MRPANEERRTCRPLEKAKKPLSVPLGDIRVFVTIAEDAGAEGVASSEGVSFPRVFFSANCFLHTHCLWPCLWPASPSGRWPCLPVALSVAFEPAPAAVRCVDILHQRLCDRNNNTD